MTADSHSSMTGGQYPQTRLRRLRRYDWSRRLVAESRLTVDDLIWPLFVHEGAKPHAVPSMPGVERLTVDAVVDAVGEAVGLGIPAVALFPVTEPGKKTPEAEEAFNPDNLVCRVVRAVKKAHGDAIGVI